MMTEPEEKLCSSLFSLAHNKRLTMLVNIGDEDLQRKYIKQAQELNIPFQLLKDGLNFNNLVTKRLLIGNSHSIGTYERLLPPDIELCVDIPTLPVFQRRR